MKSLFRNMAFRFFKRKIQGNFSFNKPETQAQQIQRAIDHLKKKIDELVYRLYGLTDEEI